VVKRECRSTRVTIWLFLVPLIWPFPPSPSSKPGVWLPLSQFEAAFVSTAHGQAEVGFILEAARQALS
jgi:hypothetical protein